MKHNLISKKELLKLTGISYGQLYRWKRHKLIPEEWFIKKACHTGQETYFPREHILTRIAKIKNLKGNFSLDDMADRFSPVFNEISLDAQRLINCNIVTLRTLNYLYESFGLVFALHLENVLYGYMLECLVNSGEISSDEEKTLLQSLKDIFTTIYGKNYEIVFLRKLGITSCFVVSPASEIFFDRNTKIIARLNVTTYKEELILKLTEAGIL